MVRVTPEDAAAPPSQAIAAAAPSSAASLGATGSGSSAIPEVQRVLDGVRVHVRSALMIGLVRVPTAHQPPAAPPLRCQQQAPLLRCLLTPLLAEPQTVEQCFRYFADGLSEIPAAIMRSKLAELDVYVDIDHIWRLFKEFGTVSSHKLPAATNAAPLSLPVVPLVAFPATCALWCCRSQCHLTCSRLLVRGQAAMPVRSTAEASN
jgi:hypothetical protein